MKSIASGSILAMLLGFSCALQIAAAEDVIKLVRAASGATKGDPRFTKAARAEKEFNERYGCSAFDFITE